MSASPSASGAGPAIVALRSATAQRHREIEELLQLTSAQGEASPIDLARYAAVLHGFERFLAHWEPRLCAALPVPLHGWFRARSRHAFVLQDLRVLGPQLPPEAASVHGGDPTLALQLADPASVYGSMYVLEGSALGGQVIARALAQQHGLTVETGTRYFTGHGADTGRMWREFRERLGMELDADPAAIGRACAAAIATFDALIEGFRSTPGIERRATPASARTHSPRAC